MPSPLAAACETPRKLLGWLAVFALTLWIAGLPVVVSAQPEPGHEPAAATASHTGAPHEESVGKTIARVVNFAILVGALVYLLRSPLAGYLANRGSQIRSDLVNAAEMKQAAAAQIAEIDRKMKALPGELEALRVQGVQEIAAEEKRIQAAAAAERDRVLEQARREIDLQVKVAERELVSHAADLAVGLATERIKQTITDEDRQRLVDRYVDQLGSAIER
jgi:F-type H+-transporting ATPase subunit b